MKFPLQTSATHLNHITQPQRINQSCVALF